MTSNEAIDRQHAAATKQKDRVCRTLAEGHALTVAAHHCHIKAETLQRWLADDAAFRAEMRAFVEANCPAQIRHHPRRIPRWETTRDWFRTLSKAGMLAPNWPVPAGSKYWK